MNLEFVSGGVLFVENRRFENRRCKSFPAARPDTRRRFQS